MKRECPNGDSNELFWKLMPVFSKDYPEGTLHAILVCPICNRYAETMDPGQIEDVLNQPGLEEIDRREDITLNVDAMDIDHGAHPAIVLHKDYFRMRYHTEGHIIIQRIKGRMGE